MMKWAESHPLNWARARKRWDPPSRCPLDGGCLGRVVPPFQGEKCECGGLAVVVLVDHFRFREPICWDVWTKP